MTPLAQACAIGLVRCGSFRDTGAVQRQSPLPKGTYWISVLGAEKIAAFTEWLQLNRGIVAGIANEESGTEGWYLFRVTGGVTGTFLPEWDALTFGFPNIATPDIKTKEDTIQSPAGNFDWWNFIKGGTGLGTFEGSGDKDPFENIPSPWPWIAVAAAGVGAVIYLTHKSRPERSHSTG